MIYNSIDDFYKAHADYVYRVAKNFHVNIKSKLCLTKSTVLEIVLNTMKFYQEKVYWLVVQD